MGAFDEGTASHPRTAAERKRQERKRMYDQGYILRHVWVRPADWSRVQKYLI
jgi:hypothetical protein